ncbi:MAG: ABC transporter ATP-binding protein [Acidobacteria bacterium]|nr:ABC transporter ATP-binding protein [Acidobacteriota bacterium]
MSLPAIEARSVSKMYRVYDSPAARLKEILAFNRSSHHREFWALDDVSFAIPRGGALGIIGVNGSGKSTLLEIAAGTLEPTRGAMVRHGRIAALLALGAGFNTEFTGRENVFLSGEILGLSRAEIQRMLPDIERFAEIGTFVDQPVKTYSTGMFLRLAFSVAIHVDPEILIVDEVLAVGDAVFVNRCIRKFDEMRRRGVTVLLVSHDVALVKQLCDQALLLGRGKVLAAGTPSEVVNRYNGLVLERQQSYLDQQNASARKLAGRSSTSSDGTASGEGRSPESHSSVPLDYSYRHGDGQAAVIGVALSNEAGEPAYALRSGEMTSVRVVVHFSAPHPHPVVGIMIRTRIGTEVYGTNTQIEDCGPGPMDAGDQCEIIFSFACRLIPQEYTLTVATQSADGASHDWLDDVMTFQVVDSPRRAGIANLEARVISRKLPARNTVSS